MIVTVVRCVGGIVVDPAGRLLLIRRGHAPAAGRWSIPGGRVEPGESDQVAVARELLEETGLSVRPGREAGSVLRPGLRGDVYEIHDYDCALAGGAPAVAAAIAGAAAGDDAVDLRWVGRAELAALHAADELTEELWETLSEWGRLPTAD